MFSEPFFKRWLSATIIGWLMGFMLVLFLAFLIEAIGLGGYQFFIGLGIGLGVGYMQGRILMFYFGLGYGWILTSVLGMGLSFMLFDLGPYIIPAFPEYNLLRSIAFGGLLTSVLQYYVLRSTFAKALQWIPFCFFGWLLAGAIVRLTEVIQVTGLSGLPAAIVVLILLTVGASTVLGVVTGIGLHRLIASRHI